MADPVETEVGPPTEPVRETATVEGLAGSRHPFAILGDGTFRALTASSGLAAASPSDSPETLKRRADEALYEAKRQGRGRWVRG